MRDTRPRLTNFNYIGKHRYSLTFCTHRRDRVFVEHRAVNLVLREILQRAAECDFAVLLYLFMPDHLHLLLKGSAEHSDLRACAAAMKQHSAYAYSKAHGKRLWQPSYWDHVIRDGEGTAGHVAYVLLNPVRAGMVEQPEEYDFWGVPGADREEFLAEVRRDAPALLVP